MLHLQHLRAAMIHQTPVSCICIGYSDIVIVLLTAIPTISKPSPKHTTNFLSSPAVCVYIYIYYTAIQKELILYYLQNTQTIITKPDLFF